MKEKVYHYTSVDAFLSMLDQMDKNNKESSKHMLTFWASNAFYMNDPSEMISIYDKYTKVLPKIEKKLKIKDNPFSMIQFNTSNGVEMEKIIKSIFMSLYKYSFVVSFSKQRDTIPMWVQYGGMGDGLCLVFDSKKIRDFLYDEYMKSDMLNDVIYHLDRGKVYEDLQKMYLKYYNEDGDNYQYKKLGFITEMLFSYSVRVKSEYYDYEKECRLMYHIIKMCDLQEVLKNSLEKVSSKMDERLSELHAKIKTKVKSKNGCLIPYVEISIPASCLLSVIVGPASNTEMQCQALKMKLQDTCLSKIEIIPSSAPYRRM